jgi:Flp pilus assembly protein TadD
METFQPTRRKRLAWLMVGLLATAGVLWATRPWRSRSSPPEDVDPRLAYDGPYRNIRPGVSHVGDQACVECHGEISQTYKQHPMGQSFFPTALAPSLELSGEAAHNPFEKFGVRYRVERRGDQVFHKAERDLAGKPFFAVEAEAAYTMGSGARGRSYLIHRDGFLFQSPISWFSQEQRWDLSPGYAGDRLFDRPILTQCLFCHCNDARPVAGTINRYEQPLFRFHAIGCERCHGPGELHVRSSDRLDIVNPARLDPPLREAVCEQCHLQGEAKVMRRGRESPFDYRPGLPLQEFLSIFVRLPELRDHKAVDQVEQMHESRCFQASRGKLGCISCHDPHALPPPERKAAYYRGRCLTCHKEADCGVAPAARRAEHPDDNCAACHMPRQSSSDIVHTAVTDHRVVRRPATPAPPLRALLPGEVPIIHFHRDLLARGDQGALDRDLGLALLQLAQQHPKEAKFLLDVALPKLEEASRAAPRDVPTREAIGHAFNLLGRDQDALRTYEEVLTQDPRRESTLASAATVSATLGQFDDALNYCRRALDVNPQSSALHAQLADLFARRREWVEAEEACRASLRLNPVNLEVRLVLLRCHLARSEPEQARKELERVLALTPPQRHAELRLWFARQSRGETSPQRRGP